MPYNESKHNTIIELFKQGKTQAEISSMYSVSKQRIGQVLARHGVTGKQGGRSVIKGIRELKKLEHLQKVSIEKYGCTVEQFDLIRTKRPKGSMSPYLTFSIQRKHANERGVEWNLKFWDWFLIWRESGKWDDRGRGSNGYCMCRIGDVGAYEIGNVYIGSVVHNSSMGRTLAHEVQKARTSFYKAMIAAGGRKIVSEALGVSRAYMSQLANNGRIPSSWANDGRAELLANLTRGSFSVDDIRGMCRSESKREAA